MHRDHERRTGSHRRTERRAVEDIEACRGVAEAERVPERVPPHRRQPTRAARPEADELEIGAVCKLPEQPDHVTRGSRAGLDEWRGVDPDSHRAAMRTASRGSG